MLRNIDDETAGGTQPQSDLHVDAHQEAARTGARWRRRATTAPGFIYHCAEGQVGIAGDARVRRRGNAGCLDRTFIGIHCNAITASDWQRWATSRCGRGRVVAVLQSVALRFDYRHRGRAPAGRVDLHRIRLGTIGHQECPGRDQGGEAGQPAARARATDRDLVAMVTTQSGRCAVALLEEDDRAADARRLRRYHRVPCRGTQAGVDADRRIDRAAKSCSSCTAGVPRYGDAGLMTTPGLTKSSPLTVRGKKRRFAIPDPDNPTQAWSWKDITEPAGRRS